jgi:CBS domain-containing protein
VLGVGVDRQLERERVFQKEELRKLMVREAMTPSFLQLDAGTSLETVARMMVAAGQDAAVVVDRDEGVVGVACLANVLSTLQESRYAAAAEPACGRFPSLGKPNALGSRLGMGPRRPRAVVCCWTLAYIGRLFAPPPVLRLNAPRGGGG